MKRTMLFAVAGLVSAFAIIGCSQTDPAPRNAPDPRASREARAKYLLASEPAGAKGVLDVKKEAKDGEAVVVVGRIGGSVKPFTGRAAFTIVDLQLKACTDIEGDTCQTPWDYCCEAPDELAKGTVLVKLVDSSGKTLPDDAKELLDIKELQTLVVKGEARRGKDNSLSVVATGIFIKSNDRGTP
jgi:hypothetical protein